MIQGLASRVAWHRFMRQCDDPLRHQANRLRNMLLSASRTEFGLQHGFRELARISDPVRMVDAYRARVPLRTHGLMREDLDAVHSGRWQRLCPSRPVFFAMTAGSTGRYKMIPVTPEFRRDLRRGSLLFMGSMENAYPEIRNAKAQFLVGSADGGTAPCGIGQGFVSGFNYRNLPRMVRRRFVLPYWVFTLDDASDRYYAAGRLLVSERRLGVLCAISPVNLVNLREVLEERADDLVADVERGTLTLGGVACRPSGCSMRPDPVLASRLRGGRAREGRFPERLLFPSLELLVCWQGGNMGYYLEELGHAFGRNRLFEFPLSASEGVMAIPHERNRPGGIAAISIHFQEYIPVESDGTSTLRADELEVGAMYRIVITTSAGLYRYDMEDVVRVRSRVGRTPVIEFVAKASGQVSISNERITEQDVTVAMTGATRWLGLWFPEFLFVPCSDRRYRVLVDGGIVESIPEYERGGALDRFAVELDRRLRATAVGYDFEREDALLKPIQVVVTAPGALRDHMARRSTRDLLPNAQVKPVHLTAAVDAHLEFPHASVH